MKQKSITLFSALAITAFVGISNTALASGPDQYQQQMQPNQFRDGRWQHGGEYGRQDDHGRYDNYADRGFMDREQQIRKELDDARRYRMNALYARFEKSRRSAISRYGIASYETRQMFARWRTRIDEALRREHDMLVHERETARARFAEHRIPFDDGCNTDGQSIDRELAQYRYQGGFNRGYEGRPAWAGR